VIDGEYEKKSALERNVPPGNRNQRRGFVLGRITGNLPARQGRKAKACKLTVHPSYSSHIVSGVKLRE